MTYRDGAVASVKDPYGVVTKLAYDRFRNLTEASDSRGNTSLYGYDLLGRCVSVTNPKGAVQKREYDLVGRVVHVLDFDGNDIRLSYDGIDNLTEYRDNVQHVEYGYSGMWKLTRRRDHRGVVNFRYDREERLRRVTNEKLQSYEFTLDAVGNVTAEKGFDGAVRHYLRDRGGRVVRETLPSGTEREYGYDACSRVTRVSYPTAGDPDRTYAYGLSGRLVQASRGESTVEFAYNSLGLPVRETADGNTILRTYDHTGRILTLDSTTGASLRYTRNGYGELEGFTATGGSEADGAGSWESSHRHDTLGFEVERILPGGRRPLVRLRRHRPSGGCPHTQGLAHTAYAPLPLGRRRQAVVRGGQQAWRDPLLLHPDGAARQGGIPRRQGAVEKERPGGEPVSRPGHEAAQLPQWRTAGAGR